MRKSVISRSGGWRPTSISTSKPLEKIFTSIGIDQELKVRWYRVCSTGSSSAMRTLSRDGGRLALCA